MKSNTGSKKIRKYSQEFLKYGFIQDKNNKDLLFCLFCRSSLSNESMKKGRLESHFKTKHPFLQMHV